MRSRMMALAGALLVAASASAQGRPDLGGEWVRVDSAARPIVAAAGDASFPVGDMGSGWDSPLTIRFTADSLVIDFVHFSAYDLQPRVRYAYALDGSESRNTIMLGHYAAAQRSRVTFEGGAVVIETIHRGPADPGTRPAEYRVRQALTLTSPTTLSVETTRLAPGATGGNVVRTTWRRR